MSNLGTLTVVEHRCRCNVAILSACSGRDNRQGQAVMNDKCPALTERFARTLSTVKHDQIQYEILFAVDVKKDE
jgi:hypothetical protein